MREKSIEQKHVEHVRKKGGESYKFVSPGVRGVPDRLDLFPMNKEHIKIVNKYVRFTECKSTTGTLKIHQKKEIKKLNKMGFKVEVINEKT